MLAKISLLAALAVAVSAITCPRCTDNYDITSCTATQSCDPNYHNVCELQIHPHDNNRVDYHCFNAHACVNHEVHHCNLAVEQTCSFCCDSVASCDALLHQVLNGDTTHPPPASTTTEAVYVCTSQADIVFVLDSSGSITDADYATMLQFVSDLTTNFAVGPNDVQFSVIIYSADAHKVFDLNAYSDQGNLSQAINSIPHLGGATYTNLALDMALNDALTSANGARPGVPDIVIVFTDGQSTDPLATVTSATNLKNAGASIMSIGVGSAVDVAELNNMASSSNDVFQVASFDVLNTIEGAIANNTCSLGG